MELFIYLCWSRIHWSFCFKIFEEDDHMVTNHRGHGHYISKTGDAKGLLLNY